MISIESATIVGRTGRVGRRTGRHVTPRPLPPWRRDALCRGLDTAVFFPVDEEHAGQRRRRERAAKAICAACPVRRPCAAYALAHRELHGVWGGLSEADRTGRG